METRTLLRSQRNDVLQMIRESGLDPFNFEWFKVRSSRSIDRLGNGDVISKLKYSGSDYYFLFDFANDLHYCEFSPGEQTLVQREFPGSWSAQKASLSRWLAYLEREVREPDLWDHLAAYNIAESDRLSPSVLNAPFSLRELEQIIAAIDQVRSYLASEFTLAPEQTAGLNEKLDYLVDAAKRQGRRDWFHTAIGVILTLAVSLALSPDQARKVWGILRTGLSGVLQLLPGH